jgi:hypothetical protein
MTDVYRAPGYECPRCPGAALRAYGDRLVCDECHGMMMGPVDFREACEDDAGAPLTVAFVDDALGDPEVRACPRCARPLLPCRVELGGDAYPTAMWRCDGDGVWIDVDALVGLLAMIARKHGRAGHRGLSDGSRTGPRIGPSGLPVTRHAVASAGLRIGGWWDRPHPRRAQPPAVDPYADRTLRCPACGGGLAFTGDRWGCATCHGVFVHAVALAELVSEMTGQPWELPASIGAPVERACPVCATAMRGETVEGVAIDRCVEHGVWFDDAELGAVLEHAGEPATGLGAWLRRLFA